MKAQYPFRAGVMVCINNASLLNELFGNVAETKMWNIAGGIGNRSSSL